MALEQFTKRRWYSAATTAICLCLLVTFDHVQSQDVVFACPEGWELNEGTCYKLVPAALTWYDAQSDCKNQGGALVTLFDNYVSKYVGTVGSEVPYFWTGFYRDEASSWDAMWDAGYQATTVGTVYWAAENPAYANTHGAISTNQSANDVYNPQMIMANPIEAYPFMCEKQACLEGQISCANGDCQDGALCDGEYDCSDVSDETFCGDGSGIMTGSTGEIDGTDYSSNSDVRQLIMTDPGTYVRLEFIDVFETEESVDKVIIYMGAPTIQGSTYVTELSGSLQVADIPVYVSSNNYMTVVFISDSSVELAGFTASWSAVAVDVSSTSVEASEEPVEISVSDESGLAGGLRKSWIFTTARQRQIVTVKLTTCMLGPDSRVDFFDGVNLLATFDTSDCKAGLFVQSVTREMKVYLHTDVAVSYGEFEMKYWEGCNVNITAAAGTLMSPGYAAANLNYPPCQDCEYHVVSTDGRPYEIVFETLFELQSSPASSDDYIEIIDSDDQVIATVTGSTAPQAISTSADSFRLRFHTSCVFNYLGFYLVFSTGCVDGDFARNAQTDPDPYDTNLGDSVTIECDDGYYFSQNEHLYESSVTIMCGSDGWNVTQLPSCNPVYCGQAPAIANGYVVASTGVEYENMVTYDCYSGFVIVDDDYVQCQANGTWTAAPTCSQVVDCAAVVAPAEGSVVVVNGTGMDHGSIVLIECNEGFILQGTPLVLCENGEWSHNTSTMTCEALQCPIPMVEHGTTVQTDPVPVGQLLTVQCDAGFERSDLSVGTWECQPDLTYDPSFICVDIDECDDPSACAGNCTNTVGSFTCECGAGYRVDPTDQTLCQDVEECTEDIDNCDHTCVDFDGGYSCTCDEGYILYTANGTGGWYIPDSETGTMPGDTYFIDHTCVPAACEMPNITNGRVLSLLEPLQYGENVTVLCDLGYMISGQETITCDYNTSTDTSFWSPAVPTCDVAMCELPSTDGLAYPPTFEPNNAIAYMDVMVIKCEYDIPSMKNRTCVYDLPTNSYRFDLNETLECDVIDCGEPEQIQGSTYVVLTAGTMYNASFTVTCDAPLFSVTGSSLDGDDTVRCAEDGRWTFNDLTCQQPQCEDPGTPAGGMQIYTNYEINALVTYTCERDGFNSSNGYPLVCQESGDIVTFNESTPTCDDVEPPEFSNPTTGPLRIDQLTAPGFAVPFCIDNDDVERMEVDPPNFAPEDILTENVTVTYTCYDYAGLSATLVIDIFIKDYVSPIIECPAPFIAELAAVEGNVFTADDWGAPVSVSDNVAVQGVEYEPASITFSKDDIGSAFSVNAMVTDLDNNTEFCTFLIEVKAEPCKDWAFPQPANANTTCVTNGDGYTCSVTCNDGYLLYTEGENAEKTTSYTCAAGVEWPDIVQCVSITFPRFEFDGTFYFTGAADAIEDCETTYIDAFYDITPSIDVAIELNCESQLGSLIPNISFPRSLMSLSYSDGKYGLSNTLALSYDDTLLGTTYACAVLAYVVFVGYDTDGPPPEIASITTDSTCGVLTYDSASWSIPAQDAFECHTDYTPAAYNDAEYCLPCPPGTYYNEVNGTCMLCEAGTYSVESNAVQCTPCPESTFTRDVGSTNSTQCLDTCQLYGMVAEDASTNNLPPCVPCPMDTYLNGTECVACPEGTTSHEGAIDLEGCKVVCPPGTYSKDGYVPCTACPVGFYQDGEQSTTCNECSTDNITSSVGANSSTDCISGETDVCGADACMNGGTCSVFNHRRHCDCVAGYTGADCGTMIDHCVSLPCYNNGTCTADVDSFNCSCLQGYSGDRCEELIDRCDEIACENQGVCHNTADGPVCVCPTGYGGVSCEDGTDPCDSDPCSAEGTCSALGTVRFECTCEPGFTGLLCETNINECASNPCLWGGTCEDDDNSFYCVCPTGYTGAFCENMPAYCDSQVCTADGCTSDECGSSGECLPDYPDADHLCVCYPGFARGSGDYSGLFISNVIGVASSSCTQMTYCDTVECYNGGTCSDLVNDFDCTCALGFTGKQCQHDIDECESEPCSNGGTCADEVNGFSCSCTEYFEGDICEIDVDECTTVCIPGMMEGVESCDNYDGGHNCTCKEGYTGMNCSVNIDDCTPSPCLHGSCEDAVGSYICDCEEGWTGDVCGDIVDSCAENDPCYSGTCLSLFNDTYCECGPSSYGEYCELMEDLCAVANACLYNSTCQVDGSGDPVCDCAPGYGGDGCEFMVDPCNNDGGSVCQNGGQCVTDMDVENGYHCNCLDGFSGELCEQGPAMCEDDTCTSGDCVLVNGNTFCSCPVGYMGPDCDKDVVDNTDLLFVGQDTPPSASHIVPFLLDSTPSFSVGVWVRFMHYRGEGTFLTLYGCSSQEQGCTDKTQILRIDNDFVTLSFGESPLSVPFTHEDGDNYPCNDGQWYRIVVVYEAGTAKVYTNSLLTGVMTGYTGQLSLYGWMELGIYVDNEGDVSYFNGFLSHINMWNRALDISADNAQFIYDCTVNPGDASGLIMDGSTIVCGPGCFRVPTSTCENVPPATDDSLAIEGCPSDLVYNSDERRLVINYPDPVLTGTSTSFRSIIPSGSTLIWGRYFNALSVSSDDGTKRVFCTFYIYIRYGDCLEPDLPPQNPPTPDCSEVVNNTRTCDIECPDGTALSQPVPDFYTCDLQGSFNTDNIYEAFWFPECSVTSVALVTVVITADYPDVAGCIGIINAGGIKAKIEVHLDEYDQMYGPSEDQTSGAFCQGDPCDEADNIEFEQTCLDPTGVHVVITIRNVPAIVYSAEEVEVTRRRKRQVTVVSTTAEDAVNSFVEDFDGLTVDNLENADIAVADVTVDITPSCPEGSIYTNNDLCAPCATGTYYDAATLACYSCLKGEYQDQTGQTECISCGTDMTTPGEGTSQQSDCTASCDAGSYYNGVSCTLCEADFYQPEASQYFCWPCLAHQVSLAGSITSDDCQDVCPSGTQITAPEGCENCTQGTYRTMGVEDVCMQCPEGLTTVGEGALSVAECIIPDCSPGYFVNASAGPLACAACPVGTYQDLPVQYDCIDCDADKTTVSTSSTSADECVGFCPPGEEEINGVCSPCEVGFYKANSDPGEMCMACQGGLVTEDVGSTHINNCTIFGCEKGNQPNAANDGCEQCPQGSYQPDDNQPACLSCPEGESTPGEGTVNDTECTMYCESGYEVDGTECVECPQGYFKDNTIDVLSVCTICSDPDFISEGTASVSEANCTIANCTAGSYRNIITNTCVLCPLGEYQEDDWQEDGCDSCPDQRTTDSEGADSADLCRLSCDAGNEQGDSDNCVECQIGFWKDTEGASLCTACPVGFITAATATINEADCTVPDCPPGEYLDEANNVCSPCPLAEYQPEGRQTECLPCPDGDTTLASGSVNETECVENCPTGEEYSLEDAKCIECEIGYYRSQDVDVVCEMCPVGVITPSTGAATVADCSVGDCGPGEYTDGASCVPCPDGQYQDQYWKDACIPCPNEDGSAVTTGGSGSTTIDDCTSSNECLLGTDDCADEEDGGECVDTVDGWTCYCTEGYEGDGQTCTHVCDRTPPYCQNGGTCDASNPIEPVCECTAYWAGETCDTRVEASSQTEYLVGGIIGAIVGIILIALILLWICWCCRAAAGPSMKQPIIGPYPPPQPQQEFVPVAAPISLYGPVAGSQGKNMYQPPQSDMHSITGYQKPSYMFHEDRDDSMPRMTGMTGMSATPGTRKPIGCAHAWANKGYEELESTMDLRGNLDGDDTSHLGESRTVSVSQEGTAKAYSIADAASSGRFSTGTDIYAEVGPKHFTLNTS